MKNNKITIAILTLFPLFWLLVGISIFYFDWRTTWSWFSLPAFVPPFADMRTVQSALSAIAQNLDPYVNNPTDPWRRVLNYPPIWIPIARIFNFTSESYYLGFEVASVLGYLVSCFAFLKKHPSVWLLLAMLSGASLLAVERGNNDILVFSMLYWSIFVPAIFGALLIALSVILKIYPVFATLSLFRHKFIFLGIILLSGLYFFGIKDEIHKITERMDQSPSLSYGLLSISAWFKWYYKTDVSPWAIGVVLITPAAFSAIYFIINRRKIYSLVTEKELRLFLIGAGIYTGTFLSVI